MKAKLSFAAQGEPVAFSAQGLAARGLVTACVFTRLLSLFLICGLQGVIVLFSSVVCRNVRQLLPVAFIMLVLGPRSVAADPAFSSVQWENGVNVDINGAQISKSGGCDGCADAHAVSSVQTGSQSAILQFKGNRNKRIVAGFVPNGSTPSSATADYAFVFTEVGIWEVGLIRFGGRVSYADFRSQSSSVIESLQAFGGSRLSVCRSHVAAAERPSVI